MREAQHTARLHGNNTACDQPRRACSARRVGHPSQSREMSANASGCFRDGQQSNELAGIRTAAAQPCGHESSRAVHSASAVCELEPERRPTGLFDELEASSSPTSGELLTSPIASSIPQLLAQPNDAFRPEQLSDAESAASFGARARCDEEGKRLAVGRGGADEEVEEREREVIPPTASRRRRGAPNRCATLDELPENAHPLEARV